MNVRVFEFPATLTGRADFRIAYETFRGRDPQKCVKEERANLADLQRLLEAVSEPMGEMPEDAVFDMRMRKLKDDGGTITIRQRLHEAFKGYVSETPFMAGMSMQVEDFLDRWEQAEKKEVADDAQAAPLRAVGRKR